ncbi:hypothetical protein [Hymenobacter cheonanensis]|uniref:hypothetical protein n=1 Tax=Hymenobacter sp. CA2-7 TaxID=3063993 RepID=UPI002713850E|nr:hypothetical protein [Hymenobacter sp. CA2-7]MDO7886296.1 hypothetical protein [Hymenobacter sp. CA2-7]
MSQPAGAVPAPGGRAGGRFWALLALGIIGLSAGYAALVLYSASWPEAAALRAYYEWRPRRCTPGEYEGLRRGLAALAALALALAAGPGLAPAGRGELAALGQELAGVARGLGQSWLALRPGQRRGALAGLAALTALRLYYSLTLQAYDDATTYELFVRESFLAANAAYPLPNNHLLSSALDWLFYQVNPGFWWSTRLPVLLVSTGATALWFLALLRRSSFRVAALAVGLFCLPLESLYYAAVGRGYWLLVGLGAVGFFSLLALREGTPNRQRAAALALVASGVLGLYAVPTHLLFLAPAYGWWALRALARRNGQALGTLLGLGALTGLSTGLLYAPLLLVSGPDLLLHHRYVAPLAPAAFWGYVVNTLRQPYQLVVWTPLTLAGLGALWGLLRWARAGQLPPALAGWGRQLGLPSAWLVLTPYLISVAQRSYPPERTLLYKAQYTCILLALAADWALRQARGRRWVRVGLAGAGLAFGALQVGRVARQEALWRRSLGRQRAAPAVAWLASQAPGPILAPEPAQRFVLRFYSGQGLARAPWVLDARPRPGVRYRYVLRAPGRDKPAPAAPPAYHGPVFDIFALY